MPSVSLRSLIGFLAFAMSCFLWGKVVFHNTATPKREFWAADRTMAALGWTTRATEPRTARNTTVKR